MFTPYSNSGNTFLKCSSIATAHADIIFTGVPCDSGVTNRPGTRFGPEAIRRSSMMLAGERDHVTRINPILDSRLIDLGDVSVDQLKNRIISNFTKCAHHQPITLGGDHSITYPILQALHQVYNAPIDIVHFDAHLDTWKGDTTDHGSPIYCGIKDGLIGKVTQIGIRGPSTHQAYDFAKDSQIKIITAEEIHTNGLVDIFNDNSDKPTYLTFDIDCIDPCQAPGTGTPEVGGIFTWQALKLIDLMMSKHSNMIGMDVVEVSPIYDISDITSLAAATIVWRYMCNISTINR